MGNEDGAQYLKQISRIKHRILADYFAPWAKILGSTNRTLGYVDCFAGTGVYVDEHGEHLPGSPLICLRLAAQHAQHHPGSSVLLGFVERDLRAAGRLEQMLAAVEGIPPAVRYIVVAEDAQDHVERLISNVRAAGPGRRLFPTFFFVDPYGHPITLAVMRELLKLGKTELLVNLMWFRLSMNLGNPRAHRNLDVLFGHEGWRAQRFMALHGEDRERAFMDYFRAQVGARFSIPFRFPFSPEDSVGGGANRTKFYLVHFSSHPLAARLMKSVMWSARQELGALPRSKPGAPEQLSFFAGDAAEISVDFSDLRDRLLQHFARRRIAFDDIQAETVEWDFIEKHYRQVIKSLEDGGVVTIERVTSKSKRGLAGRDIVVFP